MPITSWDWAFGDGTTSTQQNPSHTFPGPGTYDVFLTVGDSLNNTDTSDPVQIVVVDTGGGIGGGPVTVFPQTWGQLDFSCGTLFDPVATATGELFTESADMFLGGPLPLSFGRYYASLMTDEGNVASALGTNWMHSFDIKLIPGPTEATVVYYRGKTIQFESGNGGWTLKNPEPTAFQLLVDGSGFKLLDPSLDLIFHFDSNGKLTAIKDRNGNALSMTYNGSFLTKVSDGLGRTLNFTYSCGQLIGVVDQNGRVLSFDYTGTNLTEFTDAMGHTTTYSYTAAGGVNGLMISEALPEGNTPYIQQWDTQGRVSSQTDSDGDADTLAYDTPAQGETTITDPLAKTLVHTHADMKNITSYVDQDGEGFSLSYDTNGHRNGLTDRLGDTTSSIYHAASGKIASYTDAGGDTTTYTYTAQAQGGFTYYNLSRIDFADGTSATMTYDVWGNLHTLTDQAGNTWTYTYNGAGQMLTRTNPAGGTLTHTYKNDGNLETATDNFNNTTAFKYDTYKRLSQITWPDASSRFFTYDENDNVLTVTNERGKVITYTYDDNNNPETVTDPMGQTVTMAYDGNDRLLSMVDRLNQTTTLAYDELARLETVTSPANETTSFGYNAQGGLASVTDPGGKSFTRTYDKEEVPTSFTDPLANTWNYASDKLGRTTGMTSPLGNTHDFAYDKMGRLTAYTDPLSGQTTYTRDDRGDLTGVSLPGGISAVYTRNSLGLITGVTDPNGNAWSRGYDAEGRLTSLTDPLANTTAYAYDSRNRVSKVTLPESALDLTYDVTGNVTRRLYSDNTELQYTYDDNDRLVTADGISLSYDGRGDITGCNGLIITRDSVGRISAVTLAPGKTVTYTYNNRGLVGRVSDWVGGNTDLTYDDAGRLAGISRPNGVTTTYAYDNDGRLIGISEDKWNPLSLISLTRDGAGRITSADRDVPLPADPDPGTDTFSFDAASQVASYTYDKMGRLTADGTRTYTWDLASRLTAYTESGATTSFTYDGQGMMISRIADGTTRAYVWNYALGLPAVSVVREGGSDLRYYVHLPGGLLLHSIEASDDSRKFYHYDEIGTTVCLTDNSGAITDAYGITPYGRITATSGSTDNPFTFIGAYGVVQVGDAGLYYMRARYFDSASGRFISRDPVQSTSPKQINPYQYASCSPLNYTDPAGLKDMAGQFGVGFDQTLSGNNGLSIHYYNSCSGLIGSDFSGENYRGALNRKPLSSGGSMPIPSPYSIAMGQATSGPGLFGQIFQPDWKSVFVGLAGEGTERFFKRQGVRILEAGLESGKFTGLVTAGNRAFIAKSGGALIGGGFAAWGQYDRATDEGQSTGAVVARTAWSGATGTAFNYALAPVAIADSFTGGNFQAALDQPMVVASTLVSGNSRAFNGYKRGIKKAPWVIRKADNAGKFYTKTKAGKKFIEVLSWGFELLD